MGPGSRMYTACSVHATTRDVVAMTTPVTKVGVAHLGILRSPPIMPGLSRWSRERRAFPAASRRGARGFSPTAGEGTNFGASPGAGGGRVVWSYSVKPAVLAKDPERES